MTYRGECWGFSITQKLEPLQKSYCKVKYGWIKEHFFRGKTWDIWVCSSVPIISKVNPT